MASQPLSSQIKVAVNRMRFWGDQSRLLKPQAWLDLLFPSTCATCGQPGDSLCPICLQDLPRLWRICTLLDRPDIKVFYLGEYNLSSLSLMIWRAKFGGRPDAFLSLISHTCGYLPLLKGSILVPIPISRFHQAERGFNQAKELAVAIAGRCDGIVRDYLDEPWRHEHSITQGRAQRLHRRSMQVLVRQSPPVWLVDDVMTTGSTLLTATKALERAGITVLGAIVIAVTVKQFRGKTVDK